MGIIGGKKGITTPLRKGEMRRDHSHSMVLGGLEVMS